MELTQLQFELERACNNVGGGFSTDNYYFAVCTLGNSEVSVGKNDFATIEHKENTAIFIPERISSELVEHKLIGNSILFNSEHVFASVKKNRFYIKVR